ncbi:MAG TPA: 3-phosphoshikimate 1-carboxyvinyltransferase [Bryobacteraceae bacterium]|nr:3-phosphoshikimate 1-carboxyvinyltransferase [Bryobacteraceae bacterium]HTW67572.1 3-phosphoshikimate 1-carboxyvinyltransferase [Bryobacteraceae bacterium]
MTERVSPARGIHGVVNVPGDKSVSHRYAMLASIAEGDSQIYNYSSGADCQSTISCMQALGVAAEFSQQDGRRVLTIQGRGLHGLQPASGFLDAGNSGSTIRMLSGILAAQSFTTRITGDESLVKRPMRRIITPLSQMGARIDAADGQFPPLTIHGSPLNGIDYELPVASAQVKSCILLAGLYAAGETVVREPVITRDHTELALRELGAEIVLEPRVARIRGGAPLNGKPLVVPGDLSSAAFFIIAALMLRDADVTIANVGLNPTRTALLDVLRGMGASIKLLHTEQVNGELIGTLQVKSSRIRGGSIEGPTTAALIDEIPILAVLGAVSEQGLAVRDAGELRVKETDRIETISQNLQRMRIVVDASEDGFVIPGKQQFRAAEIHACGDHRIAMAFSVAALAADEPSTIQDAGAAAVSFPEFYSTLRQLTR